MSNRRRRPVTAPAAATSKPDTVQISAAPDWMIKLTKASAEGGLVVAAALNSVSRFGNKFWLSAGSAFELTRDPATGEVLFRIGAEVMLPCATELATWGGMLMAAAALQGRVEAAEPAAETGHE